MYGISWLQLVFALHEGERLPTNLYPGVQIFRGIDGKSSEHVKG
jgi:hypothetical protein